MPMVQEDDVPLVRTTQSGYFRPWQLLTTMTIGALLYILAYGALVQRTQTTRVRTRLLLITVWMMAILVWPLLWFRATARSQSTPYSLIGLVWPVLILLLDMLAMQKHAYENYSQSKRHFMTMDANTICSLTFAISAYIGAQNHECCNKIFLWAILGCIAFVMPAPHTQINAMETVAFEALQKAVLAYATGMLLTGVMLVTFKDTPNTAPEQGSMTHASHWTNGSNPIFRGIATQTSSPPAIEALVQATARLQEVLTAFHEKS